MFTKEAYKRKLTCACGHIQVCQNTPWLFGSACKFDIDQVIEFQCMHKLCVEKSVALQEPKRVFTVNADIFPVEP
jgi:hypothetical protein